jgi:hypothetical protein
VTLPDWQGLGLAFVLNDTLSAAYKAVGYRMNMYPAHPPYIRSFDRSPNWTMRKRPGKYAALSSGSDKDVSAGNFGGRPNATFEYVGPAWADREAALELIGGKEPARSARV